MPAAEPRPRRLADLEHRLGLRPGTLHEQHGSAVAQAPREPGDLSVGRTPRRTHRDDGQHVGDRRRDREPAPLGRPAQELRHRHQHEHEPVVEAAEQRVAADVHARAGPEEVEVAAVDPGQVRAQPAPEEHDESYLVGDDEESQVPQSSSA